MDKIEDVKALGKLRLELRDAGGELKHMVYVNNLVVTTGLNFLASALIAASASPFTHMAVGTSGTAATLADVGLGSELARAAFTTGSTTGNIMTVTWTLAPGVGTGALQEAGIFNAAGAGTMLSRTTFTTVNKAAADTLVITWSVTIS